jgi:propanol-preferring alcohol dehydrogenase
MQAMVFDGSKILSKRDLPTPTPGSEQILVRVEACGVCRTDLHILDGDLTDPKLPLVLGHEIVGRVEDFDANAYGFHKGQRVGIPWLGKTCQACSFCREEKENLCDSPLFTGYNIDGGYAQYAVANARFCFPINESYSAASAAPLLCAGLIGWRSLKATGESKKLGIYGFGAAAHIIAQVAIYQGRTVYAFTRPGDSKGQEFARNLGCVWAGSSEEEPPEKLDGAIIFAPVGSLIPLALKACRKGGIVVSGGIHMSDIPTFPYKDLWGEKRICSVANLTRKDAEEFLTIAPMVKVKTTVTEYPLTRANDALSDLRAGRLDGAAVLVMDRD